MVEPLVGAVDRVGTDAALDTSVELVADRSRIATIAGNYGVANRVDLIDGGDLDRLIARCEGVVTVNSTVGLTALNGGKPVISLGSSIYDLPGLTHQASLADFWTQPEPPEPDMPDALTRALIATMQVRGGFIGRDAIESGAREMLARILSPSADLDPPRPAHRPANSVLDNAALRLSGVELLPDFREPLARVVKALRG